MENPIQPWYEDRAVKPIPPTYAIVLEKGEGAPPGWHFSRLDGAISIKSWQLVQLLVYETSEHAFIGEEPNEEE